MKEWLYKIGEWFVINETIKNSSPNDVGKLVYIKDYLTTPNYDYRVVSNNKSDFNVRESELNPVPKNKLDYYLSINNWKQVVPKQGVVREVIKFDFLNEQVYVKDGDLRYYHSFDEIKEYKGDGKMETKQNDNVNQPNHYTQGGIETLEYMKAKMKEEAFHGFLTGNVIKYISRFEFRNGIEDLKKARVYLDRLIREKESSINK